MQVKVNSFSTANFSYINLYQNLYRNRSLLEIVKRCYEDLSGLAFVAQVSWRRGNFELMIYPPGLQSYSTRACARLVIQSFAIPFFFFTMQNERESY